MFPKKSYIICTTHRSGSNLLCELLIRTGVAGKPDEYFYTGFFPKLFDRFNSDNFEEYLPAVVDANTTPNRVFGVKMMGGDYFHDFIEQFRQLPSYRDQNITSAEMLADWFPDLRYIWLTRRNKVRQAVSFIKATQSGVWRSDHPPVSNKNKNPTYNFKVLDRQVSKLSYEEALWQDYFDESGVTPLTLVYEDFTQAPEETTRQILDFLEIPIPPNWQLTEIRQKKLADTLSARWVQQYYEDWAIKYNK